MDLLIQVTPELFGKSKCEKFQRVRLLPLNNRKTIVTLLHVFGAIHRGLGVRLIMAAYHTCLVETE